MLIYSFENCIAWKKSRELANKIYKITEDSKDFAFKNQIRRASISIMNNIAEGFERGYVKEHRRFLFISKASCAEVRSMFYLAKDLGYIEEEEFKELYFLSNRISKLLAGLIRSL